MPAQLGEHRLAPQGEDFVARSFYQPVNQLSSSGRSIYPVTLEEIRNFAGLTQADDTPVAEADRESHVVLVEKAALWQLLKKDPDSWANNKNNWASFVGFCSYLSNNADGQNVDGIDLKSLSAALPDKEVLFVGTILKDLLSPAELTAVQDLFVEPTDHLLRFKSPMSFFQRASIDGNRINEKLADQLHQYSSGVLNNRNKELLEVVDSSQLVSLTDMYGSLRPHEAILQTIERLGMETAS